MLQCAAFTWLLCLCNLLSALSSVPNKKWKHNYRKQLQDLGTELRNVGFFLLLLHA